MYSWFQANMFINCEVGSVREMINVFSAESPGRGTSSDLTQISAHPIFCCILAEASGTEH